MKQPKQSTHLVFLLIEHKRSNGLTLIGTDPSLTMNTDSSAANAKVVGSSWDSVEGGRHLIEFVIRS